jgi:hypothetical protein
MTVAHAPSNRSHCIRSSGVSRLDASAPSQRGEKSQRERESADGVMAPPLNSTMSR